MFNKPTVFIVGAGASCELGFPSGQALLKKVSDSLDLSWASYGGNSSGDEVLRRYVDQLRSSSGADKWLAAAYRIRDAAIGAGSIDTVIDQNDDDELISQVAKIAIAREIAKAEAASLLSIPKDRTDRIDHERMQSTWLGPLMTMIRRKKSELSKLFDDIAIISFNYDRSIERYLPFAISNAYGISEDESEVLSRRLKLFHPYGSLGFLQTLYTMGQDHTSYGSFGQNLDGAASRIQTFSERLKSQELEEIRDYVAQAKNLVFLGFGFHNPNMELLKPNCPMKVQRVFATTFDVSPPTIEAYKARIENMVASTREAGNGPAEWKVASQKCCAFLTDHAPLITE